MTIPLTVDNGASFFSISDKYDLTEVQGLTQGKRSGLTVSDRIQFNPTDNLQLSAAVQSLCGGDVAALVGNCNNARELPGGQNFVSDPPSTSSINMGVWECLNYTVGESMPLVNAAPGSTYLLLSWIPSFSPSLG